jgi:hypothetical protein
MNIQDRIAALELELAELKKAAGKTPIPPPHRVEEDRPLVTLFPSTVHFRHLPSEAEAVSLLKIVVARFPALKFKSIDDELENFRCAFAYVTSLTKTSAPTKKYSLGWWNDAATQWCRENGVQGVVRSLLPAIVGSGDVQYSFDDPAAVWLDPYRTSGRVVDASAWRKTLGGGDLLVPTKLNTFMDYSIGHVRTQSAW